MSKKPQTQNRYAYVRNNPVTYTDPTGGVIMPCAWDPDCIGGGGGGGGCDPGDPLCDPCILQPWLCFPTPIGGGFTPGGGGSPEQPQFPWPLLPLGFFSSLGGTSGGTGVLCECIKFFGLNRGWTGCAYECYCAGVEATAYKKCTIFSSARNLPCPFYTEWTLGPGGVGGPGSLIYPPAFCGYPNNPQ